MKLDPKIAKILTDGEKKIVALLVQVIEVADEIYEEQNNLKYPGGNLYPHDITREEFDQMAIRDPELRRFDTVVERVSASELKAIPYNVKYREQFQKMIGFLQQALELVKDSSFRVYLQAMIFCLEEGTQEAYRHMVCAWVKTKDYRINFPFGYDELYVDQLMGLKGSFDTCLFVEDEELTPLIKRPIGLRKEFMKTLDFPGDPILYPNLSSAVYHTIVLGGMSADMKVRAWNTPDDPQARQEAGARQIIIRETIEKLFENELKSLVKEIFPEEDQKFDEEQLRNGIFWTIALHEVCHNIGNYPKQKGLEKYAIVFEELKNYILPIVWLFFCDKSKVCNISDVKAATSVYIAGSISSAILGEKIKARESYTTATMIHLNYMNDHGAIEVQGNKLKINYSKIVEVNRAIFDEIIKIIEKGSYEQAKRYATRYGSSEPFEDILISARKYTKIDA